MKDAVLVIIDMQRYFSASCSRRVQDNVIRAIEHAKRNRYGIVLVEYDGNGATHQVILNACRRYKKFYRVTKTQDDGSREILSAVAEFDLPLTHFMLCGVNLQYCVRDTAIGLARQGNNCRVTVLEPACAGFDCSIDTKLKLFAGFENISLATEKEAEYAAC